MPKKATQKPKVAVPAKKSKKVPVKAESSSSEEEESEEEVVPVKAKKGAAKVNGKATKKPESSSEEESSEEEAAPVKPAKKGKAAPAKKESSSEEESSEEEEVAPVKPAKKGKAAKPVVAKKESSDEEEDSDEEESEEEAAPVKGKAAAAKKEESSEEDDSEESEEEAKPAANKRKANGKAPVAPAKKAKTDSDSDEDDSDDDDSEEEESEEEAPKKKEPKKRKKEEAAQSPPKKQKLDESADAITLFVSGLTPDTTEEEVEQFFTQNKVELASVRKPPNKRMAFVDLADNDDLDKATALTGSDFQGNAIGVEKAKPRAPKADFNASGNQSFNSSFGGDDKDSKTLFCKSLPEDVDQASLGAIFDTAADIRIPMKDGYPKGFAFIEFADSATMETAMKEKQGAELGGRNIFLDYMGSKSSFKKNDRGGRGGFGDRGRGRGSPAGGHSNSGARGESKTLFVKNLSWNTDESSLMSAFEGCVSARIPTFEDSGKPKGFAFVEFGDATQAATAHDTMSGGNLDGRQITIDFAADKRGGGGGRGGGFGGRGGGFGRGRGGDRGGFRGRGRGGDRGRGGRGGFNKERGGIIPGQGKKKTFDDSD